MADVEALDYRESDLKKIFSIYNLCDGPVQKNADATTSANVTEKWFHLNLRAGLNLSAVTLNSNSPTSKDLDFGTVAGPRLGAELEFSLPFNKGKWALVAEPVYQVLKKEYSVFNDDASKKAILEYKSVEIAFGLRHYFVINPASKLFINASVVKDFALNAVLERPAAGQDYNTVYKISSPVNFTVGAGYKLSNKYYLEFKYYTKRDITGDYKGVTSGIKNIAFIFGYQLF